MKTISILIVSLFTFSNAIASTWTPVATALATLSTVAEGKRSGSRTEYQWGNPDGSSPFESISWRCEVTVEKLPLKHLKFTVVEFRPDGKIVQKLFSTAEASVADLTRVPGSHTPYYTIFYRGVPRGPGKSVVDGPVLYFGTPIEPKESGWFDVTIYDFPYASGEDQRVSCVVKK